MIDIIETLEKMAKQLDKEIDSLPHGDWNKIPMIGLWADLEELVRKYRD